MAKFTTLSKFEHSWVEDDVAWYQVVFLQREAYTGRVRLKRVAIPTVLFTREEGAPQTMQVLTIKGDYEQTVLDKIYALPFAEARSLLEGVDRDGTDLRVLAYKLGLDFAPVIELRSIPDDCS